MCNFQLFGAASIQGQLTIPPSRVNKNKSTVILQIFVALKFRWPRMLSGSGMCFSHLGVFLISVKPLTTENTENKTTPKI